ncbi:hypothetical protein BDR26DRAFT_836355 [Obelidium mucronatum]|nr:hypothetical protein BDR26DRAFT_836355 [Obelidium mucronatum]
MLLGLLVLAFARGAAAFDFSWSPGPGKAPGNAQWTRFFLGAGGSGSGAAPADIADCASAAAKRSAWAPTFDDGPAPPTASVLAYFAAKKLTATFWVIGVNIVDEPDMLLATYAQGHQLGLHTWSHQDLTLLSDDQVVAELVYAARAVLEVTGIVPKYFRPPQGNIDDRVRRIAAALGLRAVKWSQDSSDWKYIGTGKMGTAVPSTFQTWVDQNVTNAISLQHDYFPETAAVIGKTMDILIKAGRRLVPLSECLGDGDVHNNPILMNFFTSGAFSGKQSSGGSSGSIPIQPVQPTQPQLSCQQGFTAGTDAWGTSGCIFLDACPPGSSWSVQSNGCGCLPATPVWDNANFKCISDSPSPVIIDLPQQPPPPPSCPSNFVSGIDAWGVAGCILYNYCSPGGSWSVENNKCNCLPSTPVWDASAKICYSEISSNPVIAAGPFIQSSCQSGYTFGTDGWGFSGCISQDTCPQGASWSIKYNNCVCLPATPFWNQESFKCQAAQSQSNLESATLNPVSVDDQVRVRSVVSGTMAVVGIVGAICGTAFIVSWKLKQRKNDQRCLVAGDEIEKGHGFLSTN